MAFPPNWIQIWHGAQNHSGVVQWFSLDAPFVTALETVLVYADVTDWLWDHIGKHQSYWPAIWLGFRCACFTNTGPYAGIPSWNEDRITPVTINHGFCYQRRAIVIRRHTDLLGLGQVGRMFIPNVRLDDTDGNYLTDAALSRWQTAMDTMSTPFMSQGFTVTPILASYKHVTGLPIVRYVVQRKLGMVMRRLKVVNPYAFDWPVKPPPV